MLCGIIQVKPYNAMMLGVTQYTIHIPYTIYHIAYTIYNIHVLTLVCLLSCNSNCIGNALAIEVQAPIHLVQCAEHEH